ncbi:YqiA/YcfP family alpha/beta fold hydrolase [Paraferrimonas sp. SM1919]|uniref:YqiA/YcfP family alpha/beta fold hydrolase n=1 Tax=Paraferrimonas sp. SM1919 TaxID=2662263 RepID=UPI0013D061A8|nr:YqiA/YcfP family alpha/beta fold hydrolase [Paraferrimonas sp. SM1919]
MLLYIHGFNSSAQSLKAKLVVDYVKRNYPDINLQVPELANTPTAAMAQLESLVVEAINDNQRVDFIGSSLGGYFSNYLCHQYGGKAVLINPAVKPYELLVDYLGEQLNPYTNVSYQVLPKHIEELKAFDIPLVQQHDNILLLQQSGDEVLDYRQAIWHYQNCQMYLQSGGDHSFIDFEQLLPEIFEFLSL